MKSKRLQVENLERSLHELTHLGDGSIYVDVEDVIRVNKEIRVGIEALYPVEPEDIEEEALFCVVLLWAYGSLMCQNKEDEKRRQSLLNRSSRLLGKLSPSLLKCRLLVYCYGEVYEPELAREAHAILDSWPDRELGAEEQELADTLRILEEDSLYK